MDHFTLTREGKKIIDFFKDFFLVINFHFSIVIKIDMAIGLKESSIIQRNTQRVQGVRSMGQITMSG